MGKVGSKGEVSLFMMAVVDASVALKWQFEDEEATSSATSLLNDYVEGRIELITVTLFPYEIVSAIHVAINKKRIGETAGYKIINYLTSLDIELRSFNDLIRTTFEFARKYNLSPYDCAYLSLADKEGCAFFTGDRKLFNAAKRDFRLVQWIGDYRS